jgi:hypothetical protein
MTVGEMRRRGPLRPVLSFALLAALVSAVLTLAGCASSSPHPTAAAGATAPGTATVAFHPYTSTGRLTVPADQVVRGQCWTTSIAAPGADAYRCFQGNKILDPCFAPAGSRAPSANGAPVELACIAAPWSRALILRVNGKLPASANADVPARPWAIQLRDGVRCVASTGTVPAVAGVNLTYHCTDGGNAALAGTSGAMVAAQYAAPGATTLRSTAVTTVWNA